MLIPMLLSTESVPLMWETVSPYSLYLFLDLLLPNPAGSFSEIINSSHSVSLTKPAANTSSLE